MFGSEGSSSYIPYGQLLSGTTYAQYKYNKEHPSDPNQGGNGGDPQVIQQGQDIIIGDFKVSTWSATKDYSESKPSTPTGIALEGNLCTATATLRVLKILHGLINISKLAIPLFLIIIGVVTMFTAMMSNDKDATTKAAASFAKKLAVGVAIFFIPTIINIVANLVSNYEKTVNKFSACQVCFFGDKDYSMDTCTKVINALESINNSDDSSAAKSASIEDVFSVATNSLYITSKEVAKSTVGLFVRIAGNVIEYNVDLPNVLN